MKTEGIHEAVNRKRDNIVKQGQTGLLPREYEEALRRMENYLHGQNKRCTVERNFVLQALYQFSLPVDVETIHAQVCEQYGNVSLTTVYNTLDLLVELKLARRIELVARGMSFFEKTLGMEPHGYVVCEHCGSIKLLRKPGLLESFMPQLPKGFSPDGYTLLIHGLCSKCQRSARKKVKKQNNKKTT